MLHNNAYIIYWTFVLYSSAAKTECADHNFKSPKVWVKNYNVLFKK